MSADRIVPNSVNHLAYPTLDTGETYRFYTDVMGCTLVAAVHEDEVPSTGDKTPFLHTFFALESGECMAFFEVDGMPGPKDDGLPSWVKHIALNVTTLDELDAWKERLTEKGVEFIGTVDHEGIWQSIYFFDPNGIRLELTYQARALTPEDAAEGEALVQRWITDRGQVGAATA